MFDNDVDIFWISKGFFQCVVKFYACVHVLVNTTLKNLEKEDQQLYGYDYVQCLRNKVNFSRFCSLVKFCCSLFWSGHLHLYVAIYGS